MQHFENLACEFSSHTKIINRKHKNMQNFSLKQAL